MAEEILQLKLLTPARKLLELFVDEVVACGEDGYFGVLPGHAPLVRTLGEGMLTCRVGQKVEAAVVVGGLLHVRGNEVLVLAEAAELAQDIDESRALAAKKRAEERLARGTDEVDFARAQRALNRSLTRLQARAGGSDPS